MGVKNIIKIKKVAKWAIEAAAITAGVVFVIGVGYVFLNEPNQGYGSWRSTHRSDGKPKVAFDTPERANFQSLKQLVQYGEVCHPYKVGDKYYTGHKRAA